MAVTQNTYTGNGSTVLYSFTFPYYKSTDIKVSLNGTDTTAYTLANATTIQFNTAPANGAAVRIYRVTDDTGIDASFFPGSAIRSQDLNDNFKKTLYVTQESNREAAQAVATANSSSTASSAAVATANAASATATTASANASAAVATANTASSNASSASTTANSAASTATTALNTANSASTTANSASTTANSALTAANQAVSTANAASTAATSAVNTANTASANASSALSTANTALTNSSNAVTTANTALTDATSAVDTANSAITTANYAAAAVASSQLFTIVAAVANIPASPANNAAVEIANSTGIESFTPLAGLPGGFTGSSGLSVRITYSTSGNTWNWVQYFPNDPETRYLKLSGGTLTGQLKASNSTSTASPVIAFDGDTNTGIAHTGADELAIVTGGTPRITVDGSGNVNIPGTLSKGASNYVTTGDVGTVTSSMILNGTIVDGDISSSTTISASKIQAASTSNAGVVQLESGFTSTSVTTAATASTVKDLADSIGEVYNLLLPKAGGTITGNLEIGTTGSLSFEGSTADGFETTLAVVDPTADRTITLPNISGTVVTTGDTGSVTSAMIADGTIMNGDVNASAAIAGTKISPDFGSQNVTTTGTVSDGQGSLRTLPQNSQSANYTLVATDTGKHISISSGNVTVPPSVFSAGAVITIYNNNTTSRLIIPGSGVTLRFAGTATTGTRTLAQYGAATVLCVASNTFIISGSGLS